MIIKSDFKTVYSQYHLLVDKVALNYLQNIEDAEEVTQDVFIQIYESLDTFNKQSTLKTWIYRITINKCLDFIKHKNCQKRFYIFGKKTKSEINKSISSEFNSDKSTIEKDFNPFFNVLTKHQSVENNDLKKITVTVFRNIFKSIIVC